MRKLFVLLVVVGMLFAGVVAQADRGGVPHKPIVTTTTTTTTAAPSQNCYVNSRGSKEVNVATQFGTNDAAIRSAIALAKQQGCGVYFTSTTFTYNNTLTLDGLSAYGDGSSSVLQATNAGQSAITLTGTSPSLVSVQVTSPNASSRLSTPQSADVLIDHASNFLVDHVTVNKAGSVGIFNLGGSGGKITSNTVSNTLADAIHNTAGANNDVVYGNTVNTSGDDMISVVSYQSDGAISHNIEIDFNTLNGSTSARGISVVGGDQINIHDNSVANTDAAGIYVVSEGNWNTYADSNVQITNNTVRNVARVIHNANILIGTYQNSLVTTNVTGTNNNLDRARPGVVLTGNTSGVNVGWFYGN